MKFISWFKDTDVQINLLHYYDKERRDDISKIRNRIYEVERKTNTIDAIYRKDLCGDCCHESLCRHKSEVGYGTTCEIKMTALPKKGEDDPEVIALIKEGYKIKAIKLYREITGCSLLDAKNYVDTLAGILCLEDSQNG